MSAFRGPDVFVDVPGEHVERHVAAKDHRIVERLEVVLRAERDPGLLALAVDLAVADLVSAGLAGPRAIAIDLACHLDRIRAVALDEELHALLARPALGVNAGV